jgi:ribonuclease III
MQKKIKKLENILCYEFKNKKLPEKALTHPSCRENHSYERLEFLGDLILDAVIGIAIFKKYPQKPESFLTNLKSAYVKSDYLCKVGKEMGLEKCIYFISSEVPNLDNFVESVIGAIYLDGGWRKAGKVIRKFIFNKQIEPLKDYKNLLQRYSKCYSNTFPCYQTVKEWGQPHKKRYEVKVKVKGKRYVGRGKGRTKKEAQVEAARRLLVKLGKIHV